MDDHPTAASPARPFQTGDDPASAAGNKEAVARGRRWPVRAVAGLALLVAAGLLWPFAGWSWWPVVGGLAVLVLLYFLRLNHLLFGWAPHLAGLVTVVLMAARSDPWAWGLAAGIAVLGVGLARLPRRRVLATGLVLVVVFGTGYGIGHYRTAEQQRADQAAADARYRQGRAALPAEAVLGALTVDIAVGDDVKACGLLGSPGGQQFAEAVRASSCPDAVRLLHAQVNDARAYGSPRLPAGALLKRPDRTARVDGCRVWPDPASAPGPRLGVFELRPYEGGSYLIAGYTPCR